MDEVPQSVIDALRADIRKEMSKKVAGWAVAGGAGLVGLAALGAWGLLKEPIADGLGVQSLEDIKGLIAEEIRVNAVPGLSDADVTRIAAVMASDHSDAFKGNQGDPGSSEELPAGLVAAFYRSERGIVGGCPAGWLFFEEAGGRFIVGAGGHSNVDENGKRLGRHPSAFDLPKDAVGGAETHTLTVSEMPRHDHGGNLVAQPAGFSGVENLWAKYNTNGTKINNQGAGAALPMGSLGLDDFKISPQGGDQPHNNMPPYIALYYCKKE